MTHLLDTSALLAHYLGENGADRVQALFDDTSVILGASILSLYEFELRLHQLNADAATRTAEVERYRGLLDEIVDVTDEVRRKAPELRINSTAHISAMDVLIGAAAALKNAILVHRDPHFAVVPASVLRQEVLPSKVACGF